MVPFHHQADVHADRHHLSTGRKFWRGDPDRDADAQDRILSARQQILCVGGEDEGAATADSTDPRELSRRQGEAAAGGDGALSEGKDQPDRRVLADADPDSGLLLALQGAVCHDRNASGAVFRMDQGFIGAGPDQRVQSVWIDPL